MVNGESLFCGVDTLSKHIMKTKDICDLIILKLLKGTLKRKCNVTCALPYPLWKHEREVMYV